MSMDQDDVALNLQASDEVEPHESETRRGTWRSQVFYLSVIAVLGTAVLCLGISLTVADSAAVANAEVAAEGESSDANERAGGEANDVQVATSRWVPLPSKSATLDRIAWGSCSNQNLSQPYWDTVSKASPDILVLAGDNVYGDCWEPTCIALRNAYAALEALPSFVGARTKIPILATWDDHDSGKNDGGASNPHKDIARSLFLDFFDAGDGRMARRRALDSGIYDAQTFGPPGTRVQIILLDTRTFRSDLLNTDKRYAPRKERYIPDASESKTLLGVAQWKWLEEVFAEPAEVRLVVSSIQLVADGHGWESWALLPRERQRFYDLVAATRGAVVVLSGDRHVGGLYLSPDGAVTDATASAWTHTSAFGSYDSCNTYSSTRAADYGFDARKDGVGDFTKCDEPGPNRLGPLVHENHFGVVDIDWKSRTLRLELRRAGLSSNISPWSGGGIGATLQSREISF